MKSALKKVSLILAICFVAFHLYTAAFGTMPGIAQKSIHLGFLLVIFYINAMVDSEKRWEQIFLGIMALFALGGCAYITILDENLQLRAGIVYASDILFAILLIIAIFEACRRKMGNPLVIITLVFVAYAFLGKYIPGFLNQPGMTLKKFTSLVYLTTDGIFGSPLYASASYVVLFVLLGAIMSVSGIGDYMTNLATSLFGHMRGGPAKVAVVASGFFGSISGSPTANVIGTGTFTIPMMKKNGFEPEFAAAVEATASTGGAIMPPIMGSTAFIMAEMLGIPYTAVAKAALIPAILYFLAVLFGVDIYAAKHGLKGIPRSQLPKVRSMLKQIYMLAPLIFLIFCMAVFNMTIVRSGLLTIIVTLVLVEINPKTRMTKEQWLQIPVQTVKSAVSVGIACAMAGIISGVIMGSGLGYRISSILTSVAGTSMLLLLVLTMVVSLIMGMGVPTTAAYLVLASLVAPTMIQLGIPPLAAHMFIFYFGCVGLIAFFVGLRYLKESPRWLVARGRLEEAEQVVFEITGKHVDLSEAAKNVQTKVPVMEVLTGMFRRQYIKRTLVLLAIVVFTNPATFTVTNWTATLLKAHGFSLEDSLMATTIISVGVPAGLFFSSFVTDLGGRKIPIMCMLIILAVLGPIFGNMTGYWPVVLTGVVLTAVVMAMGFTVFSYTAESYPTRMRNTATGFHSSTGRLAVAAAQPLIPMAYAAYSFDGVFWIFSFLCFVPAVVIAIWGQRTGGKSLEEIA